MPRIEKEAAKRPWVTPKIETLAAGAAEANGANTNDGGAVGNARS